MGKGYPTVPMTAEQRDLADSHRPLVLAILKRHPALVRMIGRPDATQIGMLALCRAAMIFRKRNAEFATYAYCCINLTLRREFTLAKKRNLKYEFEFLEDTPDYRIGVDADQHDEIETLLSRLPKSDRLLFAEHYWQGMRVKELAARYGATRQRIAERIQIGLSRMRVSVGLPPTPYRQQVLDCRKRYRDRRSQRGGFDRNTTEEPSDVGH